MPPSPKTCPEDLAGQVPVLGGEEMPFTYGELQAEMDMINRAYIEVMMEGEAMGEVRAMGFGVGLHTGGFNPGLLRQLLPLLDWIGLDIKAPRHAYARITGVPRSGEAAWESLDLTLGSSVPYEVRTTYHPDLLTESDLRTLARELAGSDARN